MHKTDRLKGSRSARIHPALMGIVLFGVAVVAVAVVMFGSMGDLTEPGEADGTDGGSPFPETAEGPRSGHVPEQPEAFEDTSRERITREDATGSLATSLEDGSLRGSVVEVGVGPVAKARVKAVRVAGLSRPLPPEQWEAYETQSTADGRFSLGRVPPGNYILTAEFHDGLSTGRSSGEERLTSGGRGLAGTTTFFLAGRKAHPRGHGRECEIPMFPAGTIAGRVVGPDGEPVADALVAPRLIRSAAVQTDETGRFTLANLPEGRHDLLAAAAGLTTVRKREVITGRSDVEITLTLGGSISGKVTLDGKPAPRLLMIVEDQPDRAFCPLETFTTDNGRYVLEHLSDGHYNLTVVSDHFVALTRRLEIRGEENHGGIDFKLRRTGSLSGRVTAADTGAPMKDVWVIAYPAGGLSFGLRPDQNNTRTDHEGKFLLPALGPTKHRLGVNNTGDYIPTLWEEGKEIEVAPAERKEGFLFALERGAHAVVMVRGKGGEPVTGARLNLGDAKRRSSSLMPGMMDMLGVAMFPGGGLFPAARETGEGVYSIRGLPSGVFNVTAYRRGWVSGMEALAIGEGDVSASLEIILEPTFSVFGKVQDPAGKGVAGASVSFRRNRQGMTKEDGSFHVYELEPGFNSVDILAEGYLRFKKSFEIQRNKGELLYTLQFEGNHFLSGRVKNDLGVPLAGVKIGLYQREKKNSLSKSAVTDEDGSFRFDGLVAAKARLSVDSGQGRLKGDYGKLGVDQRNLEVVLERFARVKGTVKEPSGEPVPAFIARYRETSVRWGGRGQAFTDGVFDLKRVVPEEVRIFISTSDGLESSSDPITLKPGEIKENVTVTLKKMGSISGWVRDLVTGKPVKGARVFVNESAEDDMPFFLNARYSNPKDQSEEDGTFKAENIKAGKVDLAVQHPDYREGRLKEVTVVVGQETAGIVIFLERGSSIVGTVLVDGVGKAGVRVKARGVGSGKDREETPTGKEGFYRVENLSPGEYRVSAEVRTEIRFNNRQVERTVTVGQGEQVLCDLILGGSGILEGRVFVFGEPEGNISVNASPMRSRDEASEGVQRVSGGATSREDGTYRIEGLPPGRYHLYAHRWDFEGGSGFNTNEEVEVGQGITVHDIHLGAQGNGEVSGTVYKDGAPISNVNLFLSTGKFSSDQRSDENGYYRFTNLPAGRVHLNVFSNFSSDYRTYGSMSKSLDLKEGEAVTQDFHIATGTGAICGTITRNGEPDERTSVNVRKVDGEALNINRMNARTSKGVYRFESLAPGRYEVRIHRPWTMCRYVTVSNDTESKVDFEFYTGTSTLAGKVKRPEDQKVSGYASAFLFTTGTCTWKEGQPFKEPSFDDGLYTRLNITKEGTFAQGQLPASAFDVVAVLVKDGKILQIDTLSVTLVEGGAKEVELNVTEN